MSAPHAPPIELRSAYTMGERYPLSEYYVDESSHDSHYVFSNADIIELLEEAHKSISSASRGRRVGSSRQLLTQAIVARVARSSRVLVFGSTEPWVEALAIAAGAESVTTVEYQKRTYMHPQLHTITVAEHLSARPGGFDCAIAHAAFDHDGLGRYGDRLHPAGDLLAMRTAWRSLRPNGTLLLTLPVGPDLTVWNLHRRYGALRLPRMLRGWEEVERLGWEAERLHDVTADHRRRYEPLWVLRRNGSEADELPPIGTHDAEIVEEEMEAAPSAASCDADGIEDADG